jgi:hypothetical protein
MLKPCQVIAIAYSIKYLSPHTPPSQEGEGRVGSSSIALGPSADRERAFVSPSADGLRGLFSGPPAGVMILLRRRKVLI